MRIAQIMLAKGFGGAERSFVDLSNALVRRGHDVLAITDERGLAGAKLIRDSQLTLSTIRVWGVWDRIAAYALRRKLSNFKIEVVQLHLARAAHLGGNAAHSLGLPSVAKTHNYVKLKYYRQVNRLVPTTIDQQRYLIEQGVTRDRIVQIPNFSAVSPVMSANEMGPTPQHILAFGRMVRKKGFDVLIHAIEIMKNQGIDVKLILGGDGPERPALAALIKSLGLKTSISIIGWINDVAAALDNADIFVLPSRDEPFGIALLEAMARGVSIVATKTAGPLEILNNDTARLVEIDNAQALAQALIETLKHPKEARQRAVNALLRFEQIYSSDQVVGQYERVYQAMLADN